MVALDELAEFQALSLKVSEKTASDAERGRWRVLREQLRASAAPVPSSTGESRSTVRRRTRKLKVGYAALEELHATFTEQLSTNGLELRLSAHVKPDTMMLVRLELGPPAPLLLTARVAWCRRDGGHFVAGFELTDVRQEERERIEAWLVNAAERPDPSTAPT